MTTGTVAEDTRDIPVVFVTSLDSQEGEEKVVELGCSDLPVFDL